MKKQKKFNRKLKLNKVTIATLTQKKVLAGRTAELTGICYCPCNETVETEIPTCPATCVATCIATCAETCDPFCTLNTDIPTDCKPYCINTVHNC